MINNSTGMNADIHCHADQLTPEEAETELTKNIVIGVASNFRSGEKLLALQRTYPNLKVYLGIHPEHPGSFQEFDAVEKQIRDNAAIISGIGEIGLPYFNIRDLPRREKLNAVRPAEVILEKFLRLADEMRLPVNLHCVEDTLPNAIGLLKKFRIKKALFHWFEGDTDCLKQIIREGWHISISPDIVRNSHYRKYIEGIASHVKDIFTLESDGPWEYGGKRGIPSMVEETAEILADIYKTAKEDILEISNNNSVLFF